MITSAEEFVRLRTSEDPAEYRRADSDEAPEAVWMEVVERHPDMRSWVALNKTVPVSILERLADDPDPGVRGTVARKRKLTPELMARLAGDPDDQVRHALVYNASCPPEVLRRLENDAWPAVADKARARLRALPGAPGGG